MAILTWKRVDEDSNPEIISGFLGSIKVVIIYKMSKLARKIRKRKFGCSCLLPGFKFVDDSNDTKEIRKQCENNVKQWIKSVNLKRRP